jgi:HD-like signal output (HDOD) protein
MLLKDLSPDPIAAAEAAPGGASRTTMNDPTEFASRVTTLASLPEVYLKVRALLDDPRATMADVAGIIGQDPGLTARLLRIANSAMYGFAGRIATVSRAVTMLGTQQVHDLVLATSVTRAFARISPALVNMDSFWRESVHCGLLTRALGARCDVLDVERLFVEGLLRDVGHLVLYHELPNLAAQALEASRQSGTPLYQEERRLIGFDFAEVGAELLKAWGLPEGLQEVVRDHVEPDRSRVHVLETALLHIATTLAAAGPDLSAEDVAARACPPAWSLTSLTPAVAVAVAREVADQVAGVAEMVVDASARPHPPVAATA